MSDVISLEFIGAQLRAIQAEQRTLRMENELMRKEVSRLASDIIRAVADRIATFEALVDTRLDQQAEILNQRFEQLSAQIARLADKE